MEYNEEQKWDEHAPQNTEHRARIDVIQYAFRSE